MTQIKTGKRVADFSALATGGQSIKLSDFAGKNIVLYFYPKDKTPGCTKEGQDFRDNFTNFQANNTVVFGVSRDTLSLHEKFKNEQDFPFELISDKEENLCKQFDVIKEKNMYGKKVMGIERSTFIIDSKGVLRHEWRKVKVDGHVDEVLMAIKEL